MSRSSLSILLASTSLALLGSLSGCAMRTPGIEVSMMVMPLDRRLVEENADIGMSALEISTIELVPCPAAGRPVDAHSHAEQASYAIGAEPTRYAWSVVPGAYCDVRISLALEGAAPREVVLRAGCAEGRLPVALSHAQRSAEFVLSFPPAIDVQRIGEPEVDRQRALAALIRGLEVERIDCERNQPLSSNP